LIEASIVLIQALMTALIAPKPRFITRFIHVPHSSINSASIDVHHCGYPHRIMRVINNPERWLTH